MGRRRGVRFCSAVFLFVFLISFAHAIEKSKTPAPTSFKVRCIRLLGIAALVASATYFAPVIGHDISAATQQKTHIGMGIYLDSGKIWTLYWPYERDVISHSKSIDRGDVIVANIVADYLFDDYETDAQAPTFYPAGRDASTYFRGQSLKRGVCREKAVILAALLNLYGVDARVQMSMGFNLRWHVWVYLPKEKLYIDPTRDPHGTLDFTDLKGVVHSIPNYSSEYRPDETAGTPVVTDKFFWIDRRIGGFWR